MSGKKPSPLRNALREMKVNEPPRLSKSGPSFRPPPEIPATVQTEVPPREAPLSEAAPQGAALFPSSQNEAPQHEAAQNKLAHLEATKNEVPRNERSHIERSRNESPKVEGTQIEVTQHRHAQIEQPQNKKAQGELPQTEAAQIGVPQMRLTQTEVPYSQVPLYGGPPNKPPRSEGPDKEQPRNEPSRNEVTHNQRSQIEAPQSEGVQLKQPQNESPQHLVPQNELDKPEAPRKKQTKNEGPQNEVASPTKAPQIEPPQIEQPSRTFFRLSDRAFSYQQLQRLSGDCFRLFLWMSSRGWRFQHSDGTLRASVGYIEGYTAMSHATISRCLKTLKEESLIELLEIDYKRGNLWSISPIAFAGCDPENLPPRSGGPQNEAPRKEAPATSKRDRSHLNLREKPPQNEGQIRSIKNTKNLSQEGAQLLLERIEKIRAPEKQKTEREGLIQLLETHQPEEIEMALRYVEKYGTLSNEGCHSPFRYLARAIDEVLHICQKKGLTLNREVTNGALPSETATPVTAEQEAKQKEAAFAAFETELTEQERATFIAEYVEKEFTWGYKPAGPLLHKLAAIEWYRARTGQVAVAV